MPKLKVSDSELDVEELENSEYDRNFTFDRYEGEVPATGTMLLFRVTKMWWTYTQNDDPMLKVLAVAEDNPGNLEEYDGLPAWESLALTTGAKFRWAPFFEHFGLNMKQVKNQTMIDSEDDSIGAPITKIGKFVPGSDDALFVGVVKKERYQGNWQAHISEWLDADTELEEPEEEEKPARRQAKAAANGGRKRATGRGRSRREEPDEDPDEVEPDEPEEDKPHRRATSSRKPASRSNNRSRRSSSDDDEPPF